MPSAAARKTAARKRGPSKLSAATISRDIRLMGLTSLNFVGGVQYLNRIAKKNPAAYLAFIAKLVQRDDSADANGMTFVIQQINIGAAPIAGVTNSPVLEHVQRVEQPDLRIVNSDG